jgi:hypothetical protein
VMPALFNRRNSCSATESCMLLGLIQHAYTTYTALLHCYCCAVRLLA